ncbi:MAG: sigma-70 family RNA polymerase sigma factor [SAR202 cluster bacterium]|nr:sigma-70 family RNA polymerase sigma factor [SAR202 cluster bacterium]
MTTGPTYFSEDELIKRLQIVQRDVATGPLADSRMEANARESRNLVAEVASRVYAEPERWGISNIPEKYRDDAAHDALVSLLQSVGEYKGQRPVTEWFAQLAEAHFRRAWMMNEPRRGEGARPPDPSPEQQAALEQLLDAPDSPWKRFERDFPQEAFALRVRYLMNRSPEEMAVLLDAPDARAIVMRLNRARDRFRMFCEQAGMDRKELAKLLTRLGEDGR